jgi:hypothetical protein
MPRNFCSYIWPCTRFILAAVFLAGLLAGAIAITTRKHATHLEDALVQVILFAIGLAASFYIGTRSVKNAASDVIRPSAKAALRRLVSLGRGLNTIQEVASSYSREARGVESVEAERIVANLDILQVLVEAQVAVVIAAMEDWRDFTPDLVNELQAEGQRQQ